VLGGSSAAFDAGLVRVADAGGKTTGGLGVVPFQGGQRLPEYVRAVAGHRWLTRAAMRISTTYAVNITANCWPN
jgi:hypothetical protein